jgi:hypothetical protein
MNYTNIYILIDPTNNEIKYVGKANNIKERFKNHKNRCRDTNTYKRHWINKLRLKGLYPELEVIDIVPVSEWHYWEKFWISYYKSIGCNLTNTTSGGDGLSCGNKTSFKRGQIPWNKGKSPSKETKLKISNTLKGNIPYNRKPVIQYDLLGNKIQEYLSCHHAAKVLNTSAIRISDVCNGNRKTHKKYIFKFKN